jgi:transcriptional regulator with XRE-family HTH domain
MPRLEKVVDNDEGIREGRRAGGRWLKKERGRLKLTQQEVATRVGIKYYTFIAQVENGHARLPERMVGAYAKALNIDHDDFMKMYIRFYEPPGFWQNSEMIKEIVDREGQADNRDFTTTETARRKGENVRPNHRSSREKGASPHP